jgi:hypothetical protein
VKPIIIASFHGDADYFLRTELGLHRKDAIIVTPGTRTGLAGFPLAGARVYDIRRNYVESVRWNEALSAELRHRRQQFPDMVVTVDAW